MKKKLLILATAALLALGLSACDNSTEADTDTDTQTETESVTETETVSETETETEAAKLSVYTVKVVDKDGNPLPGAYVQMCEDSEEGVCFLPVAVDENGVYSVSREEGNYKVKITLNGYTTADEYYYFRDSNALTITMEKDTVDYTVTVVDKNGAPIAGATVQFCQNIDNGMCYLPGTADENGVFVFNKEEGSYKVLVSAPNYVNSEYCYFNEGETSMTVTLEMEEFPFSDMLKNVFDGHTVYDETVMFIDYGDEKTLLFPADKIISVTSYDGKKTYTEGVDYELRDGKLVILEGSKIPCITGKVYYNAGDGTITVDGKKLYWGENAAMTYWQVRVTYEHSADWSQFTQTSYADRYADFISKLKNGEDVTVYFYGDSITAGANASYFVGVEPRQNAYTVLFLQMLAEMFDYTIEFIDVTPNDAISDKIPVEPMVCGNRGTITYINSAIGGWSSQNGISGDKYRAGLSAVKNNIKKYGCDLFVLAFGMNDGQAKAADVAALQEQILNGVLSAAPDASLMLVATMVPHPNSNWYGTQVTQFRSLLTLADQFNDDFIPCAVANMTQVSLSMYLYKDFEDCTGNNINHPNDFLSRIYAQTLFQTLIGYENIWDLLPEEVQE